MDHASPASVSRHWELHLGGDLMADLFFAGYDFPWIAVRVVAQPALSPFWPYFDSHSTVDDDDRISNAILEEVERLGGFVLVPDGEPPTRSFSLVNFDKDGGDLRF